MWIKPTWSHDRQCKAWKKKILRKSRTAFKPRPGATPSNRVKSLTTIPLLPPTAFPSKQHSFLRLSHKWDEKSSGATKRKDLKPNFGTPSSPLPLANMLRIQLRPRSVPVPPITNWVRLSQRFINWLPFNIPSKESPTRDAMLRWVQLHQRGL